MTEQMLRELYGVELEIMGEGAGRVVAPKPGAVDGARREAIAAFLGR